MYSADQMKGIDLPKIKELLDSLKVPYMVNENNLILVPKGQEQHLRIDLGLYGFPKPKQEKGYDLFDSTTWIKGEKELQILELRALKGQLERDLTQFENVRSASVILDIPQMKSFSGESVKAKASVILDLVPGTRLSPNELRAITNHLASAVRGLKPNMVAISDTTGKMYQGLDQEGSHDSIRNAEIMTEDYIKAKIDGMLATLVGLNNFYTTVQVLMNRDNIVEERKIYSGSINGVPLGQPVVSSIRKLKDQQQSKTLQDLIKSNLTPNPYTSSTNDMTESEQRDVPTDYIRRTTGPGKIASISIGVLVNEKILTPEIYAAALDVPMTDRKPNELKKDIENQMAIILKGYDVPVSQSVDFLPFFKPSAPEPVFRPHVIISDSNSNTFLWAFLVFLAGAMLFLLFKLRTLYSKISNLNAPQNPAPVIDLEDRLEAIRNKVQEQPSVVIDSLKAWIKEDKL
jgi:flagellar biosynthesis/type III secretory pathway M-ring protein FliF/YscJ